MTDLDDAATQVQDWLTEKTRLELAHACALKALLTHMGWPASLTVPFDGVEIEIRKVEEIPEGYEENIRFFTDAACMHCGQWLWFHHQDRMCPKTDRQDWMCRHCTAGPFTHADLGRHWQEAHADSDSRSVRLRQAIRRAERYSKCPKCGQEPYDGHDMCSGSWEA